MRHGRRTFKWIVFFVAGMSASVLGVIFSKIKLEQADQVASVMGIFVALAGLVVSTWSALEGRAPPGEALSIPIGDGGDVKASLSRTTDDEDGRIEPLWAARKLRIRSPVFVGREALLTEIHDALAAEGSVLALWGQGGVGKTSIAAEYAHRSSARYDVVWWVDAGRQEVIAGQLRELAQEVGIVRPDTLTADAVSELVRELRRRDRWLIVLDNAVYSEALAEYFAGLRGHLLITTRDSSWNEASLSLNVTVFDRAESVELLRRGVSGIGHALAGRLGEAVGDLPIALAQASSVLVNTGMPVEEYLRILPDRAAELMDKGRPGNYPTSLATSVLMSMENLIRENEIAGRVLRIRSFLASEPTPTAWFVPMIVEDEWRMAESVDAIRRTSQARLEGEGLVLHGLIGAIIKGQCSTDEKRESETAAIDILLAARPGESNAPANWPEWALFLPHVIALRPGAATRLDLQRLACDCGRYLLDSGQFRSALSLIGPMRNNWRLRFGDDHEMTLAATHIVACAYREQGDAVEARRLNTDTLSRRRRLLGKDHPDTLSTANNLANDLAVLGERAHSRRLNRDVFRRRRRTLGPDHLDTVASMVNLAEDLGALHRHARARDLNERALSVYSVRLGERHPRTLITAVNLAENLRALGEVEAARALDTRTLDGMCERWGPHHRSTLYVAGNLVKELRLLGMTDEARALEDEILLRTER